MRLIDADALYEKVAKIKIPSSCVTTAYDLYYTIVNAPGIDAVPVRHGHWNMVQDFGEVLMTLECRRCSVCGHTGYHNDYRYCPTCGARMDGDSE